MAQVEGVGPERAKAIRGYFQTEAVRNMIADFKELGLKLTEEKRDVAAAAEGVGGVSLAGKTLVVTGSLAKYGRAEIEGLLGPAGSGHAGPGSEDGPIPGDGSGAGGAGTQDAGVAAPDGHAGMAVGGD